MKTSQEEIHYLELYIKESMYILLEQVNSECKTTLICDVWNQNTLCIVLLPAVKNYKRE